MSCIALTESAVADLKAALRREYAEIDEVKSSHLSEALACALGFKTHAALLATVQAPHRSLLPADDYRLIDYGAFLSRLQELSGLRMADEWDAFEEGSYPGVIKTDSGDQISYRSQRDRAWRNVVVGGINAGLDGGLFTIRPDDNRWPGGPEWHGRKHAHVTFELAPGLPAIAWFSNAGSGELNVGVAVNPTAETLRQGGGGDSLYWGDAVAHSWLERKLGAWLQSSTSRFACRRALQPKLAALDLKPRCFGDRGKVIM